MAAEIAGHLGVPPRTIYVAEINQPVGDCVAVRIYFTGTRSLAV